MRLLVTLLATAALGTLTACSAEPDQRYSEQSNQSAAPDIAPSVAPDVAFSYAYRFALAADAIAAAQEKHAAACEALGLDKCRITGVAYRRLGKDHAEAALELALAPDIARRFGKDATATVEAARGTLNELEIGGRDQSGAIQSSRDAQEAARAERRRLEQAMADPSTTAAVRQNLRDQIANQRDIEQAAVREGRDARALVASTPMQFAYSTDGFIPGLSVDRTARSALGFAAMLLNGLLALVVVLAALAIPIGLILLGAAHIRRATLWLWERLAPPVLAAD